MLVDWINNNMYMKKNSKRMAVMMLAAAAATSKMKIKCFSSAFVTPSTSSLIVHSIGRRSISFGLQNGSNPRGRRSAITATTISASNHQHRALLNSFLGKHHKNPSSWTAAGRTGNFNMNSFAVYYSSCHFATARSSLPPL